MSKKSKQKKQNLTEYHTEFKKFINKGNIFDLAAAIVIGATFNAIVTSLANNIITPCINYFVSDINLEELKFILRPAVTDESGTITAAEIAISYGNFIQAIIQFLITALFVFIVLKIVKAFKKHVDKVEEAAKAGIRRRKRFLFWKLKTPEPEPPKPEAPKKPTEAELLEAILKELQLANGTLPDEKVPSESTNTDSEKKE